jgi:hypothetical protein
MIIEGSIDLSRYYDLQRAYQDCHEKLLAAEVKVDKFRGDSLRVNRREVEMEKLLTEARRQKDVTTVQENILRIHYEASLTEQRKLREIILDLEKSAAYRSRKYDEIRRLYQCEKEKKMPLHERVKDWLLFE